MAQRSDDRRCAERHTRATRGCGGQAFLNGLQSVFNSRMSPPSPVEPSVAPMLMVAQRRLQRERLSRREACEHPRLPGRCR